MIILKRLNINLFVYILLRILIVCCMILQIIKHRYDNAVICLVTLGLFTIPNLVKKNLEVELPTCLEVVIYFFIFSAEILGEVQNFYGLIDNFDTVLHTINGFLMGAIGFSLINLINKKRVSYTKLSPFFVCLFSLCFSISVGVLWEFGEFGVDYLFNKDCQKDKIVDHIASVELNNSRNKPFILKDIDKTIIYSEQGKRVTIIKGYLELGLIDTMKDLFVNFIGGIIFIIFGFLYMNNKEKYSFVENLFFIEDNS